MPWAAWLYSDRCFYNCAKICTRKNNYVMLVITLAVHIFRNNMLKLQKRIKKTYKQSQSCLYLWT